MCEEGRRHCWPQRAPIPTRVLSSTVQTSDTYSSAFWGGGSVAGSRAQLFQKEISLYLLLEEGKLSQRCFPQLVRNGVHAPPGSVPWGLANQRNSEQSHRTAVKWEHFPFIQVLTVDQSLASFQLTRSRETFVTLKAFGQGLHHGHMREMGFEARPPTIRAKAASGRLPDPVKGGGGARKARHCLSVPPRGLGHSSALRLEKCAQSQAS